MLAKLLGHSLELALWQGSLCSQECAAHWGPTIDRLPGHALDVAVDETLNSIVDAERIVSYKSFKYYKFKAFKNM